MTGSNTAHRSGSSKIPSGVPPSRFSRVRSSASGSSWYGSGGPAGCGAVRAETPTHTGSGRPRPAARRVISYATRAPILWPKRAYGHVSSDSMCSSRKSARRPASSSGARSRRKPWPGASSSRTSQESGSPAGQRRYGRWDPPAWCRTNKRKAGRVLSISLPRSGCAPPHHRAAPGRRGAHIRWPVPQVWRLSNDPQAARAGRPAKACARPPERDSTVSQKGGGYSGRRVGPAPRAARPERHPRSRPHGQYAAPTARSGAPGALQNDADRRIRRAPSRTFGLTVFLP